MIPRTKRSTVKISDDTGDAAFNYSMEAMEALYDRLGDDYVSRIVQGLLRNEVRIIRLCIRAMLQDTDLTTDDILAAVPLKIIVRQLLDAIMLNLKGMTYSELMARPAASKR